ncbi:hypothetical protein ANN_15458 [Periplaneta americana]|uniref:Uncharacterized protein n=1 Tax=Periplaneta americana TaxID=6978 RepID=A0ABQ8SHA7_PERAM|nr:hypothetical protein ANN_15458 [Periplaneta americana]
MSSTKRVKRPIHQYEERALVEPLLEIRQNNLNIESSSAHKIRSIALLCNVILSSRKSVEENWNATSGKRRCEEKPQGPGLIQDKKEITQTKSNTNYIKVNDISSSEKINTFASAHISQFRSINIEASRAVASWSKASYLGLALRNANWFESSWGKKFSHDISASV